MTEEQFEHLSARATAYAARRPRAYLWRVACWAALGYAVVLGALVLCVGLPAGLWRACVWASEHGASLSGLGLVVVKMLLPFLFLAAALVRSLWVRWPEPEGVRLRRAEAPALFAAIDEIARRSEAPRPSRVLLDARTSAGVAERPRLGIFPGWPRRYLILGLPLLAALSEEEFRAVLAHEFAHLRGRHGRFGNRIYRLREIWGRLLTQLAARPSLGVLPLRAFVGWYAPRFNAVSFALARRQEFEADRWAAGIVGARTAAGALLRLVVAEATLDEEFWPALEVRTRREPEPPAAGTMLPSLTRLRLPLDPRLLRRRLARVLARETEGGDTHPAPAERLTALGFPAVLTPPGQPGASALRLQRWNPGSLTRLRAMPARSTGCCRRRAGPPPRPRSTPVGAVPCCPTGRPAISKPPRRHPGWRSWMAGAGRSRKMKRGSS